MLTTLAVVLTGLFIYDKGPDFYEAHKYMTPAMVFEGDTPSIEIPLYKIEMMSAVASIDCPHGDDMMNCLGD